MDNWEHLDSPPMSEDLVIFGKYMGSTYKEVLTDAPYCQWVMTTANLGEASAPPVSYTHLTLPTTAIV